MALLLIATACLSPTSQSSTPPMRSTPVFESIGQANPKSKVPEDLANYCTVLKKGTNPYFGTLQRAQLATYLDNPPSSSPLFLITLRLELARDYLRFGETREAVRLLEEALNQQTLHDPAGVLKAPLLEALAVSYLKMGELANCLTPAGSLICTLPLDKSLGQKDKYGSTNAIGYLLQLLQLNPDNMKARWLLNIAHMTLRTYPEQVPPAYLIPVDALRSDYQIGQFDNVASAVGLYALNLAGGSIVEDFDNDGLLDIVTSSWDPCAPMRYFHNEGNGQFNDYTSRAGLDGQLGGLNMVQTDYNNDGWMDILVLRGAWLQEEGQMRMSLLRNNGDGTFTDVTHQAGLALPAYPRHSAAWADYDNDGDLDLFVCNESIQGAYGPDDYLFPSQLFRNKGDGTFTDVAAEAGVTNLRFCKGSTWGDFDNDGDPDLYVSNLDAENRLYRNNGDGTFTDVAIALGLVEPIRSFATWFWDYNNDGWLDLFVAGFGADIADVAADYLGLPNGGERPRLYKNNGAGGFTDVTQEVGLFRIHPAMGANFGDLDNDGFPDFYLGTGYPSFEAVTPNVMYRNAGGQTFIDVTFAGGFGHLQKGHGIAFGDIDRDGDQDVFAQLGGAFPGGLAVNALYGNPGHDNRWLSLRLVGDKSNRAAIGARITVEVNNEEGTRVVYRHVSSGGSFGASPLEQHVGLGKAQRAISLEVYWPTSRTRQLFRNVPLDSYIEIHEGRNEYKVRTPQNHR